MLLIVASLMLLSNQTSHAAQVDKTATPLSRAATYNMQGAKSPLGTMSYTAGTVSPGVTVGYTWLDEQHQCSVGRMVGIGPHSGVAGYSFVHFSWTYLPEPNFDNLRYRYSAYRSTDGSIVDTNSVVGFDHYGGYVNIDVTPDNRAVVGGQTESMSGPQRMQPQIHYDACPACGDFTAYDRVPDPLAGYGHEGDEALWPRFLLQFGADTVLHVLALGNDHSSPVCALLYFRKAGYEASSAGEWDDPPYVVDSVPLQSYALDGNHVGSRVAMTWFANLPYQEPGCDTCSGISPYYWGYMDNDAYLQISNDQGLTWEPRQNLTQASIGNAAFKPFSDCSILFDQANNCHVLFHAVPWPADPCIAGGESCMEGEVWQAQSCIMHWSENVPYIRTVCDHTYQPSDSCGVPNSGSTVCKMSLGECDGKLYSIWTQFNDIPHGIDNDCAEWAYAGEYWDGANGEIWVSISQDGGTTWDAQRNLTNSYTPHCDPLVGYDCQSDNWASVTRWGKQVQTGENWSVAEIVDPSGGSSVTDYYLDVQYVNDLCAGTADAFGGIWTDNPIKWFRLKCVDPVLSPIFACSWHNYGDPNYQKPDVVKNVPLDFENLGNVALTFTIGVDYVMGDPGGWLSHAGFGSLVPSGLGNVVTGYVILNSTGMATGNYNGYLVVTGNDPVNLPDTIWVEMIVADTICPVIYHEIGTEVLSLAVSNHGNTGHSGVGTANMDYYPEDCDSTAKVYLFDGSPLAGRIIAGDTVFSSAIWGVSYLDDGGFRPQCWQAGVYPCNEIGADVYGSGTFTTQDSTIAFEKIYLAPHDESTFIVEHLRLWSFDGASHADIMTGEAVDWNVPGDDWYVGDVLMHPSANTGHVDPVRNLAYLQGYESYSDTGYPYNCQYNDERFGGLAFVESYLNGSLRAAYPFGGFIGENDLLQADKGFLPGPLYQEMSISGLRGSMATEDLHAVLTFEPALDLGAEDVYEVVTLLATVQQGTLTDLRAAIDAARTWYVSNGGMSIFADDDGDGRIDICHTSCCAVIGDFDHDGLLNPLDAVAFVTWLWRGGPGPVCCPEMDLDCDCQVTPSDVIPLVQYLWFGVPLGCNPCAMECWQGWYGPCP